MPTEFHPFYERVVDRFPLPFVAKTILSMILGLVFLVPHLFAAQNLVFTDWSWLLGVLITTAMLLLYYATHTLRGLFPQMRRKLGENKEEGEQVYLRPLRRYLTDRKFVLWGAAFGALNCAVGFVLGPTYEERAVLVTIYLGFFIAGFVCGMATCGIRGVVIALTRYAREGDLQLDYSDPDSCGGMLFLGDALIKFSAVTLVVGVLITAYILSAGWTRLTWEDSKPDLGMTIVRAIMWVWICLPFILSMIVLLAPAAEINRALQNHKLDKVASLRVAFEDRKKSLERNDSEDARDEIRKEQELYASQRTQLHAMRTWPFNTTSNLKFLVLFISNAVIAVKAILGALPK